MNHSVAVYKRPEESIAEKPNPYDDGQGLINANDVVLEPVWSCGPGLPNSLVDILDIDDREEEAQEENEDEDELDFDDLCESDDDWCSDNYHFEARERVRRGSSEKNNTACYLRKLLFHVNKWFAKRT